ncbi:hypothetical protein EJB05_39210 [Eragrostis curvula]|uniref:HMA domain-containing protein n=1 Tax=Eragrostis curvula TaxID=38414 RepID=A0A5J9TWX0_9POAL|nr:hypothetical protein EJB05_39193 [Eragrostis curvula]TVU15677.1 hypothetical protein EJB05_39210 [Eragrostis curvula]
MVKKKIVIKVNMPSDESRAKAMGLVSGVSGVISVSIIGDGKDRLEVVGEGVDAVSLACCLRGKKKFGHVEILLVEDVKDKKKEEEEKKKKEEAAKKKRAEECSCPGYPCYCHPRPPPYFVCEEPATSCSIL